MSSINERWAEQAMTWEYTAAASPELADIPIKVFPSQLHEQGETRVIGLDLAEIIGTSCPATTPNLMANYLRICQNDKIQTAVSASSEVFFVMRGKGYTATDQGTLVWQQGDAFTLPTNSGVTHYAEEDTALFWVHDAPMLQYIGAIPATPRFEPTYYSRSYLDSEIARVREAGIRENRNRNGVILGNPVSEKNRTMTHTMWSLYNLLPKGATQQPHRHNSVAIDLAVYAESGTYTLIGKEVDAKGNIINPVKAEWMPNTAFVTPPGWWHSHHNDSNNDAYVFPVQDAGMQIYMRTLDIQFVK